MYRSFLFVFFLIISSFCLSQQNYPQKSISLVHGFGVGGNIDTVARIVAAPLAEILGQPINVESKTGAGGVIADTFVAKAKPDGYTLLMMHGGHAVSAATYKSLPYKSLEDFSTISMLIQFPFVLTVKADSPFKSLADIISAAKAKPETITYSTLGPGSTPHLIGELIQSSAQVKMISVPYRGGSTPLIDLIGGQFDVMIDSLTVSLPSIKAGKIRAIAVTSSAPWPSLMTIPTIASTLPDFDVRSWHAIGAPKGLPKPIVDKLVREIHAVLNMPSVREKLESTGAIVRSSSPEVMHDEIYEQIGKWKTIVKDAKIPQL
jgi:tripartite-type tricarboxylate transporter receptor subunit TctC